MAKIIIKDSEISSSAGINIPGNLSIAGDTVIGDLFTDSLVINASTTFNEDINAEDVVISSSFKGDGSQLHNITASNISNFTNDVRAQFSAGTNIAITGGVISSTAGGSGTVTSVSVVSANGLAGTLANATTTPAITLSTTVTGLLKGNGTAISAAVAGTDYQPAGNYVTTDTVQTIIAEKSIDVSSTNPALRVTQTGTGFAIRVEDTTTPDSTPFVVTADGNVGVGTATPLKKLHVSTSGLLIDGTSTVQSAPYSARLIVDTGTSTGHTLADLRNSNGSTLFVGGANVGIGTNTPGTKLEVNGDATITGDLVVNGGDITTTATALNITTSTAGSDIILNATDDVLLNATDDVIIQPGGSLIGLASSVSFSSNTFIADATTSSQLKTNGQKVETTTTAINIDAADTGADINIKAADAITNTVGFKSAFNIVDITAGVISTFDYQKVENTVPIRNPDGTAGAPAYSFTNATGCGMNWNSADGVLAFSHNASNKFNIGGTAGTSLINGGPWIRWGAGALNTPTYSFHGDSDTGIYSPALGSVSVVHNGRERCSVSGDTTTTNAVAKTIYTYATTSNTAYSIMYQCVCRQSTGAVNSYIGNVRAKNVSGTVTAVMSLTSANEENTAPTIGVTTSGANILFTVTGAASTTFNWFAWLEIISVS